MMMKKTFIFQVIGYNKFHNNIKFKILFTSHMELPSSESSDIFAIHKAKIIH